MTELNKDFIEVKSRKQYKSISIIVSSFIMIVLISWLYQPWQIMMRGFPIFRNCLDIDKWRLKEDSLAVGIFDITGGTEVIRQRMVSDLICHHKEIYLKRDVLIATLGKSIQFTPRGGKTTLALLDGKIESTILHSINSRHRRIQSLSGFCITKDDVIYVAGESISGCCLLIFFYDNTGNFIDCAWLEEQ